MPSLKKDHSCIKKNTIWRVQLQPLLAREMNNLIKAAQEGNIFLVISLLNTRFENFLLSL